jgi:ATP synthase protein I
MTQGEVPPPNDNLDARLKAARQRRSEEVAPQGGKLPVEQGAGAGYRVSVELFAGMLFGGGVGWFLDRELGTKPWLMVLLFLLGAAAGLLNSYRAVMRANREPTETPPGDDPAAPGRRKKD